MRIVRGSDALPQGFGPSAVGIGVFDGVHRGHQKLLGKVLELARAEKLASVAYSFDPHPAQVLNPKLAPKLLESIDVRLSRLEALGLDTAVLEPFTRALSQTSAEDFVRQILVGRIRARHVVVGQDFKFGHKQGGNVALLEQLGSELGFTVHPVELLRLDGIAVTSTKVREFVWAGAMRGATLLLGRPYQLSGIVMRGAGRGHKLGFATANLSTHAELIPARGVYAARASGPFGNYPAVVNIGYAPTFGISELKIEAHLLDYTGDPLYGQPLAVDFIDRIRDEQRFSGPEELVRQIQADVERARELLRDNP